MADTTETAFLFAMIMVAFSLFMASMDLYITANGGQSLVTASDESLVQLALTQQDFESMTNAFQTIADVIGNVRLGEAPTLLGPAAVILGFFVSVLTASVFGWIVYVAIMTASVGLSDFNLFFTAPLFVVQMIGLLEAAHRFKKIIPFQSS